MGPGSALLTEGLGALLELVAFTEAEGEVDSSGESEAGVADGLLDTDGDALGEALEGEAPGVPDGAEVAEVPEADADATGDAEGVGSATGSDLPHPHQGNETTRQPPSPLPLAWATEGTPTAPTTTTATAAPAIFWRFDF
ncbi:hypothetical protein [Streptomyces sp. WM6386]|uniref:hypothetical protein n=1 Tax=Streptomyces sp. WM6386 TaxID=1415558 RepID=UPI0006990DE1|nr:hypothetical protein [Streptomyces sp. WM6386]